MAFNPVTQSNVGALSAVSNLVGSLTNLILATPQTTQGYQPQNAPPQNALISLLTGPPGILFHYEGEQSATLSSDITDHFIENNSSIQDQVALKPVVITTHGFIGELNNVPPPALALLQQTNNTLLAVSSYSPTLTVSSQESYNKAFAAYQLAQSATNAAISAVSSISGNSGESVIGSINGTITKASNQNKQQTYFQQFYGYWQTRTLFTLQTPWAVFQNMAILNLRAVQSAETRTITDFEVSFKQINYATTLVSGAQAQGRLTSQSAANQNNGTNALLAGIGVAAAVATIL